MKKALIIIGSVVLVFILIIAGGIMFMSRGLDSGKNLTISSVDVASLKDGTYNGKYSGGRWTNEVIVTVENQKITKIDIVTSVQFEQKDVTDQLFSAVIKKQNTDVDIMSGATVTSKAYLKSIENALTKVRG